MSASNDRPSGVAARRPVDLGEPHLVADEEALFFAAARVLLEGKVGSKAALRALFARSGRARPAPAPMPEQPLAPGLLGLAWRRLRAAIASTATDDLP